MNNKKRTSEANAREVFGVITSGGEIIRSTLSLRLGSVMAACLKKGVVIGRDAAIFRCWNGTGVNACVVSSDSAFNYTIVLGILITNAFYSFFMGYAESPEESMRMHSKRFKPPAIMAA